MFSDAKRLPGLDIMNLLYNAILFAVGSLSSLKGIVLYCSVLPSTLRDERNYEEENIF